MKSVAPMRATSSHAMRKTGKARKCLLQARVIVCHITQCGNSRRRVLCIVPPAQRTRLPERSASGVVMPAERRNSFVPSTPMPSAISLPPDTHVSGTPAVFQPLGNSNAMRIINSNNGACGLRDQPLLDRGIMLQRAMTIQMIRRDIEQQTHGRIERRRQIRSGTWKVQ